MVSYRSVALNTLMVIEHGNWTSPMEVYSWELGTSSLNIGLPIATFDYRRVHVFTLLAYFWVGNRCLPFVGHWTSVVSIIPLGQIPTTTQQHLRNIQFAKLVVVFGCLRKKHPHICFFRLGNIAFRKTRVWQFDQPMPFVNCWPHVIHGSLISGKHCAI
jgi:hypothetical protein